VPTTTDHKIKLFLSGSVIWTLLATLVFSSAFAASILEQRQLPNGTEFSYQRPGKPTLSFVLDPSSLPAQNSGQRRYSVALAQAFVRHQLQLEAVKLQQQGFSLRLSPPAQPLSFELRGPSEKLQQQQQRLLKLQEQAYQQYLAQGLHYQLTTPQGGRYIIPDHVAILQQQLPVLKPIANAFINLYGQNNIRVIAAQVALWVQQIPYQDLSDRQLSAGAGFVSPWQLLHQHSGDCDSKAVLFAAIMQQIFPHIKLAILYFPDHAVIAAQIPAIKNETTVAIEGKTMLVIDATGPAETAIGTLAKPYQLYLHNGQFNYRLF
jgi:hypothetical protein